MARRDPGEQQYAALVEAMETDRPACRDYELFTADDIDNQQFALAKRLCADCPLRALCQAYAVAAKPTAGIWAGKQYGPSQRRRTDNK